MLSKKPRPSSKHSPIAFFSMFLLSAIAYVTSLFYPGLMDQLAVKYEDGIGVLSILHMITHMFAHSGFIHLTGNFVFGGPLCIYLERKIGSLKFLAIWFITGVCGSLFFMITPSLFGWTELLGSSVAISGCVFYALLSCKENKIVRVLSILFMAFLFMSQYIATCTAIVMPTGTAFAAHLGGMVTAMLLYCLVEK